MWSLTPLRTGYWTLPWLNEAAPSWPMLYSNRTVYTFAIFSSFSQDSDASLVNLDAQIGTRFNKAERTAKPSSSKTPFRHLYRWILQAQPAFQSKLGLNEWRWKLLSLYTHDVHAFTFKYSTKIRIWGGGWPDLTAITGPPLLWWQTLLPSQERGS